MGPIAYSLCQKPVIGLVMFITSACAFPALFMDQPLSLQQAGPPLVTDFKVPVSKSYLVDLAFEFPSAAAYRADQLVGTNYTADCERDYADIPAVRRQELGRSIPIRVVIREKKTRTVVVDQVFNSLCMNSAEAAGYKKHRSAGRVELVQGAYVAEISNLVVQPGLDGVKTTVSLVSGHGK